ncbi:MAG: thioredoxin family protein [Bacteroidales bacterium]|nr:thioredoxin family protein [Bacteroidales bacterium]
MIEVNSYADFISRLTGKDKTYLLLYKKGSEKSDCAFSNVQSGSEKVKNVHIFHADVTHVRDIHERFDITTVPVLLEFRNGEFINTIKGCNDASQYKALFEDTVFRAERKDGEKPARRITVYSTPTCSWCNTLKTYLKLHNVLYTDVDVSRDQKAADALVKRSGQMGVPQTDINGEIIVGFNKARINQLLGITG